MSTIEEIRRSLRGKKDREGKQLLYEDPEFTATDENIFFSRKPPRPFIWKRPGEIVPNPKMFVGGASRLDIKQGQLGDCWLLAAVSSLTSFEPLLKKVVPHDQGFDDADYCGAFKFTFWIEGQWTDIIIDDRLPTYNNRLVFLHSDEKNEFWSALLEKAYAKINGSYEALKGGQTSEAMEDFTGGLAESIDLKKAPADLYKTIRKALAKSSLMGCSLNAVPGKVEAKGPMGLVRGHAYSVTGAQKVNVNARGRQIEAELVRVRNPWGNEREWEGDWGDKSSLWTMISEEEKKRIGLVFDDDGEFWMSFADFKKYFDKLEICMLGPDSADTGAGKAWEGRVENAKWAYKATAGGCRNFLDTFWTNPQFRVTLQDPDDDEDVDNCSFVVSLMQCGRRKLREQKKGMLTIGFSIYEIKEGQSTDGPLDVNFFKYNSSVARSPVFINSREVTGRYSLPPGEYVVIPSTFNPNEVGKFMVRLYSEKPAHTKEMDTETKTPKAHERKPKLNRDQKEALNSKFYDHFLRLAGQDGAVDADELKEILTKVYGDHKKGFSLEVCRSLVGLYDDDHSGKLGFEEFMEIWVLLKKWHAVFDKYDKDHSDSMDMLELWGALKELGISLSSRTKGAVSSRFRNKAGTVDFDSYVQIIARVFALNDAFDDNRAGTKATFSREEYFNRAFVI